MVEDLHHHEPLRLALRLDHQQTRQAHLSHRPAFVALQELHQAAGSRTPGVWATVSAATASRSMSVFTDPGTTYCFRARTRDVAGNLSAWSTPRCTTVPVDDASLRASAQWDRGPANGWLAGTYSSARAKGATLTRGVAAVRQIGVIATTCPGCGSIAVYIGASKVGVLNLSAASTTQRRLVTTARFASSRTGAIRLITLTNGLVKIDGLAITAT